MDLIPGFIQGITRVLISYPFDYIRTNIQMNQTQTIRSFVCSPSFSFIKAYSGCSIPLVIVPLDRAIQFFIYERLKYNTFIAALASSSVSAMYSIPMNHINTLIVTKKEIKINLKTVYRGGIPDGIRNFISGFIYIYTYGNLRKIPEKHHNYFLFGVISSLSSWLITYPLDTLRVLRQTQTNLPITSFTVAYRGFSLLALRILPSAGAGMWAYEKTLKILHEFRSKSN